MMTIVQLRSVCITKSKMCDGNAKKIYMKVNGNLETLRNIGSTRNILLLFSQSLNLPIFLAWLTIHSFYFI